MLKRAGGVITGSHTTVTPEAATVVDAAQKQATVTKISLGFIRTGIRTGRRRRLKIRETKSGLEVVVRGTISVQTLYIQTQDKQAVQLALEQSFER